MSEQFTQHEVAANQENQVEKPKNIEHPGSEGEQSAEKQIAVTVEAARLKAQEQSKSSSETPLESEQLSTEAEPTFVSHNLKNIARNRLLKQVRENLPKREKLFSQIIHQPAIDSLSELSSKTIGRPSGLLAGGICALLGSSVFLYIAKHDGYRYNFLLWGIFFVGGFVVGLILEALAALLRRLRS